MLNYKKSLLSVAAIAALTVTSLSANYIPLTDTAGNDKAWVLFGVTGLKTTGAGAGTSAGTFGIPDNTADKVIDTTDDLFTEGFLASTGQSLGKVKVLKPYNTIQVRIDTSGAVFNNTEPIRTMYVALKDGGGPAFAVTYRASLEGHEMQYSTSADGSDAHTVIISSVHTYNNPALGAVIQEIAGIPGSGLSKLSDMVDYDFSDNPVNFAYYDKDKQQEDANTTANEYLRVYSFDTATETWELYDSRNNVDANDFSALVKGKAYWAKMNDSTKEGGLVLGSSSISPTDYVAAGITDGWNLMAFDGANPYIRKSETGLILELKSSGTINIYDSSANHSVSVDINNTNMSTVNTSCKGINDAIKTTKLEGKIPDTFDLKAFAISATQIALISSKRFIVEDTAADVVGAVKTLANQDPYTVDPTNVTITSDTAAVSNLGSGAASAMSKYGESSLIFEPIYTAHAAGAGKIHIQSAYKDSTAKDAIDPGANINATVTATNDVDMGGYKTYSRAIDVDYNGTVDRILISSTKPFYMRDHTFTRVFKYNDTNVTGEAYIRGTGSNADITLKDTDHNVTDAVTEFDGNGNVHAAVDPDNNTTQFVIITDAKDASEYTITEATTTDHLTDATTSNDIAKGAVKGVNSLSSFVVNTTSNTVSFTLDTPDDANDSTLTTVKSTFVHETADTTTIVVKSADVNDSKVWATDYKALLETLLSTASISATVSSAEHNATAIDVNITSTDILNIKVDYTGGENNVTYNDTTVDKGKLSKTTPDLTPDLKFNAVYAPNYVADGPLYTMNSAGFDLQALVTGTTDISDGSINWDSIDLTRTPADWLDSQDYNLFQVNETSGYWAYLATTAGASAIAVSVAELKPLTYTYHFNKVSAVTNTATNYNHFSGNIALTIAGLDTDARAVPIVNALVAGSVVELSNINGGNAYTGKISSYEVGTLTSGYNYDIFANIADGLGNHLINQDLALKIDYEKPTLPTIDLGDGTNVTFTSSADTAGYYIFNGQIPEVNTENASNLFASLTSTEAAGYALCAADKMKKLEWDEKAYDLNVIAVDGAGVFKKGNVSDTNTKKYVPMLKDAVRLIDTDNSDSVAATIGEVYDATCTTTGPQTVNYGVTLTAETDLHTVKIAYSPENISDTTATPVTLFVKTSDYSDAGVAKITYADIYAGKQIYIDLGGHVYSLILPTSDEISTDDTAGAGPRYGAAGVGAVTDTPLDLVDGVTDVKGTDTHGYAEFQKDQSL